MFTKFLIFHFVKDYKNTSNEKVRENYGLFAGIIGIIVNIILFSVKLIIGIISNSIAVTADAFNNLSDGVSSVITIIGFKIANKPADEKHPFGHGRIEYISAIIVSFMVLLVGFEFIKASFNRILHPSLIKFEIIPFILILLSIVAKIWLSKFNKYIGNKIDSSTLKASSFDAFSDVITSSCVALSLAISNFTSLPVDGYIGILIALFVMYSGFSLIKETLNPLLGEAPDPKLVNNITTEILNYKYINGVHDLIIHNYGPGKYMASIHAEVPCDIPILEIHEIIDQAEKKLSKKYNILLVIHMDPIDNNDKQVSAIKNEILEIVSKYPLISSIHDFRIIGSGEHKNLIFDVVIDFKQKINESTIKKLKSDLLKDIKNIHPLYETSITIDRGYTYK